MSFPPATPASATCSPSCFVMGYGSDFATSGNSCSSVAGRSRAGAGPIPATDDTWTSRAPSSSASDDVAHRVDVQLPQQGDVALAVRDEPGQVDDEPAAVGGAPDILRSEHVAGDDPRAERLDRGRGRAGANERAHVVAALDEQRHEPAGR